MRAPRTYADPRAEAPFLDWDAFRPIEQGAQAALFPETHPGAVVFVCFPDVEEREFVSLLENARPSFVIDLASYPGSTWDV